MHWEGYRLMNFNSAPPPARRSTPIPVQIPTMNFPPRDLTIPAEYARTVTQSAAAFHRLARCHQQYAREQTAAALNKRGRPTSFTIGQRVQIYVPPTASDIDRTGRPAKHITAWRGPCVVEHQFSDTTYAAREEATGRGVQPDHRKHPPLPPHC